MLPSLSRRLLCVASSANKMSAVRAVSSTSDETPRGSGRMGRFANPLNQRSAAADEEQAKSKEGSVVHPVPSAFDLVAEDMKTMFREIHEELDQDFDSLPQNHPERDLSTMSKYYFDGHGKAVRPVIAMTLGHAYNEHMGVGGDEHITTSQRKVAIISEMIHTSSLIHDDILDHAETRRGKPSVNRAWDIHRSTMSGVYVLAVTSRILAQLRHEEVVICLSRILRDLVTGEFQQMQTKNDEQKRFELYLSKTFNKTASLIAYASKASAMLAGADKDMVNNAYEYGRNVGIAFQLVDDLLDFQASSEMLGKPAAADLKLGLATAPVLFAQQEFPQLEAMIKRRFTEEGDIERAFEWVNQSSGLPKTRELAQEHCAKAVERLEGLKESKFKWALIGLTEMVLDRKK